jgi:uncharacterized protein YacL
MPGEEKPKKRGWFQKIPFEVLMSPGGAVLMSFAVLMEIMDFLPIPFIGDIIQIILEIIFIILLIKIAKVSFKSCIIPFLIERVPIISNILPTWVIRLFI